MAHGFEWCDEPYRDSFSTKRAWLPHGVELLVNARSTRYHRSSPISPAEAGVVGMRRAATRPSLLRSVFIDRPGGARETHPCGRPGSSHVGPSDDYDDVRDGRLV